ncbi:MAG: hypothetical protein JWQ20_3213 [Conexibacter sp.]|nr:hypothetical protein [Conexibacter sp.]
MANSSVVTWRPAAEGDSPPPNGRAAHGDSPPPNGWGLSPGIALGTVPIRVSSALGDCPRPRLRLGTVPGRVSSTRPTSYVAMIPITFSRRVSACIAKARVSSTDTPNIVVSWSEASPIHFGLSTPSATGPTSTSVRWIASR